MEEIDVLSQEIGVQAAAPLLVQVIVRQVVEEAPMSHIVPLAAGVDVVP